MHDMAARSVFSRSFGLSGEANPSKWAVTIVEHHGPHDIFHVGWKDKSVHGVSYRS